MVDREKTAHSGTSALEISQCLGVAQRLQEIIGAEIWPPHRTVQELNNEIPQIRQRTQNFLDALRPLKQNEDDSWYEADSAACKFIYGYGNIYAVGPICNGSREYPEDSLDSDIWGQLYWTAVEAVFWELSRAPGKPITNPFLALFGLYELGATRVNFCLVDDQEMLVIDFPLVEKHEGDEVACLAFGDNEQGDQDVRYVHGPWEPCSENRLIGLFKRRIELMPIP